MHDSIPFYVLQQIYIRYNLLNKISNTEDVTLLLCMNSHH